MSFVEFDTMARNWAVRLEDGERVRSGVPLPVARKSVARRIGIMPGTLEALRNNRLKGLPARVYARIRDAFVAELSREIVRCSHELELARQAGLDPRCGDVAALQAAMREAEKIMAGLNL